ncbi:MAG: hypothetical protein M3N34_10790 [Pseudomonadota bacterium]|nr:hypothetical protein [Pseudomonadota bacterium]
MMKPQTSRQLRKLHQYVGLFFTPAILFFAFSGALQTLGLHENHGAGPPAPVWIQWMASVHKDQRLLHPVPDEGAAADKGAPGQPQHDERADHHRAEHGDKGPSPLPMKAFVILLSLGLIASSLLGVTIALTNRTFRKTGIITLALGTLVPVALLYL